ncbi:H-NS family histone-like protein [Photobacterium damselae]
MTNPDLSSRKLTQMEETIILLSNYGYLRQLANKLTHKEMEVIERRLTEVFSEVREEAEKAKKEEKERKAKITEYIKMLKQDGIDPNELSLLAETHSSRKKKRAPKAPKYRFIDSNGEERTWTGQGRTPSALTALLEQGHSMEEFLIINL